MRLRTQLVLASAVGTAALTLASAVVQARQIEQFVTDDAREEAAALAAALAASHYSNVSMRNDAQLQLAFEAMATRTPDDVAYVVATDAREGDRVIAAVPRDLVGAMVPDVVPLAITRAAMERAGSRAGRTQRTFLLRAPAGSGAAGDPVIDAVEDVRLREGSVVGALRVGIRYTPRAEILRRELAYSLEVAGAVLLLGVALATLVARRMSAPLDALRARMAGVTEGRLEPHDVLRGTQEVRDLAAAYNQMITGLRQKRALERYVPLGARRAIDLRATEAGIVPARRERVAILFADLRGFSTKSEKQSPSQVLHLLNAYADAMTGIVVAWKGDVNELLGDAVLAVFTGPEAARNAVGCAAEMQERLATVADGTLRMGIGLHMGDVVLGTVGTGERLKFAVVGDAVNVAARIQERSKDARASAVLASDDVRQGAGEHARWIDRGEAPVRGREGTVHLWELESGDGTFISLSKRTM